MGLLSYPRWEDEGKDFPFRAHSRIVEAGPHRWHVQRAYAGPPILLLHGTGASVHSFAPILPRLGAQFEVVAVDLPNHGFTRSPRFEARSVEAIAQDLSTLLDRLGVVPQVILGHSAGAAIGLVLALRHRPPSLFVSLNGALRPFDGAAGFLFPLMAKALFYNPFVASVFARSARDSDRVARLIAGTGSDVPEETARWYRRLLTYSGHVSGALGMMADWDLAGVERRVADLPCPALFLAGEKDKAVPPADAHRHARAARLGTAEILPGLGHLAHEEDPARVADLVIAAAAPILHEREAG